MKKIIECVPNFSEGRNKETLEAISKAIEKTEGCRLLDVDPGNSTNRTVFTFVGDENSVIEGALAAAKTAYELIDMRTHTGEHPRMGVMDVCPFIPVANVTMEECVEVSKRFAKRLADELGATAYLYEESSERDYRKKLPDIRQGEYEGMKDKVKKEGWEPDYWSGSFDPKWGCTAVGARKFLIAYNINVLAPYNQAHRIALDLREAGRGDGEPGILKETKGLGWYVEDFRVSQISMNLNDYHVTPPHVAFEAAKKQAKELNISLAGSELVGLIPLEALLMAADYYMDQEGLFIYEEHQKIMLAVDRLGLSSVSQFDPKKKIIEYLISEEDKGELTSLTLKGFIESVAARTAAPGGGSVAAAIAGLGAGLGSMTSWLTFGVRKFEEHDSKLREILPQLSDAVKALIPLVDDDTNAFEDYVDAMRLPKDTDEERAIRDKAMQDGLKKAIEVPLSVMRTSSAIWPEMKEAAKVINIASKSDMEIGARALELGIWGAYKNVVINMADITDESYKSTTMSEAERLKDDAKSNSEEILEILDKREG
ncbi:MAG: hypothetical protein Kapaf2KO_23260 [Candidatus Kapaibacteriales bacterium]